MTNRKSVSTAISGVFTKRIGSTFYRVGVHFSGTSKETAKDKIVRLVHIETKNRKATNQ